MPHTFRASLRIIGADFDPDVLTGHLGIAPTASWKQGEQKGKPGRGTYTFSSWSLESELDSTEELETHIDTIMHRMKSATTQLQRLDDTYSVSISCAVYVDAESLAESGTPSIGLTSEQIQWLGEIKANFDVDLYIEK